MEKVEDKRVRVFKIDKKTEIKNFVFLEKKYFICPKLLVISGDDSRTMGPYLFVDGILENLTPKITTPNYWPETIAEYTYRSMSAVVKDQLHFFGGYYGNNGGFKVR